MISTDLNYTPQSDQEAQHKQAVLPHVVANVAQSHTVNLHTEPLDKPVDVPQVKPDAPQDKSLKVQKATPIDVPVDVVLPKNSNPSSVDDNPNSTGSGPSKKDNPVRADVPNMKPGILPDLRLKFKPHQYKDQRVGGKNFNL